MKSLQLLALFLLLTCVTLAQKQVNDPNAESRNVKGFHAVKVATGIDLLLSQGNTEAVAVSASTNEHRDRIKTVVENGVLKIYYDNNGLNFRNSDNRKLKAYVSIINIDGLDISSGASVTVEGTVKSNKLDMDVSSGGSFKGKVDASTMTVDQSSGAVINMSGTVGNLTVDGSSGSMFKGYELTAENCNTDVNSGSGVQVTVNKELSVDASSGGFVNYKGSGVIRNVKTSSGGNVSKKG